MTQLETTLITLRHPISVSKSTEHALRQLLNESELTVQSIMLRVNLTQRKRFYSSSETLPSKLAYLPIKWHVQITIRSKYVFRHCDALR